MPATFSTDFKNREEKISCMEACLKGNIGKLHYI